MRNVRMLLLALLAILLLAVLAKVTASPGIGPSPSGPMPSPSPEDLFAILRRRMVEAQIVDRGVKDEAVLAAMLKVPRHLFVPPDQIDNAYDDRPLPIGYGQTISQPYIVAIMTELLRIKRGDRVLEIGTGSGYQAAILAEITDEVYTVEIIPQLAQSAEQRLRNLGYQKVKVKNADGYFGWEEFAPYDAIIVTCAPDHVPQPLLDQLKEGGRLVIPVGPQGAVQTLWQFEKRNGQPIGRNIMGVLFVPLVRGLPGRW